MPRSVVPFSNPIWGKSTLPFTYLHGGALVYGSQEVGYPGRINFFKYVPVDWQDCQPLNQEYTELLNLYNTIPAIRKGEITAYPDEHILAFQKSDRNDNILVLVNVRHEEYPLTLPSEWAGKECTDLMTGEKITLGESVMLEPYEYMILK